MMLKCLGKLYLFVLNRAFGRTPESRWAILKIVRGTVTAKDKDGQVF